jgi:PEP-CTERM motif-containing protein
MRPIDLSPRASGQHQVPLLLSSVWLLVLTITWSTSDACYAVSFSLGDQLVTIGQNFTGASLSSSGFIPPDTMGAVGPTAFVELINGQYSVYDKSSSTVLQTSSLDQFWRNAGVSPTSFTFDPRVVYDPFSERYLAASVDNQDGPNNFLLAASKTSDPTQGWSGFAISSDPTRQRWADFPTLGFNRDGVYLSANMFRIGDSTTNDAGMVAIPKADLLAPTPTVAHATLFEATPNAGFAVQPAVDLDNRKSSAILLSSPISSPANLKRSDIIGDIRSPRLNTAGGIIPLTPFATTFGAVQPELARNLEILNGSILHANVVLQNNALWGVQTISDNGQGALRWFQIDGDTNKVLQEGLIKRPGFDLFYGSIAVNKSGDVVIGFTGSSKSQFASAYAVAGTTINGKTLFGDPLLLRQGVASYERLRNGRNRWGDYSATTLDPSNSKSFWTIQEWASGLNSWSTQITEIRFGFAAAPEPSTLLLFGSGLLGLAGWRRCRRPGSHEGSDSGGLDLRAPSLSPPYSKRHAREVLVTALRGTRVTMAHVGMGRHCIVGYH